MLDEVVKMVPVAGTLVHKADTGQTIFISSICRVPCLKGEQEMALPASASSFLPIKLRHLY